MLYANPVAREFMSGSFYAERAYYLSPEKLESDYAAVRFERELRLFRASCLSGSVLDVGCSTGGFLHQLKTRHPGIYECVGIDVPGPALDYAEDRGLAVVRANFLDFAPLEKRFDAITFWAVMEHLADPVRFLSKVAELLVPGGHCFVLVPNMRSLAVRLLGVNYRYVMSEHLNYFTPATLKAFAARANAFTVVDAGSSHFNPFVIWQDFRYRREEVPDAERGRLLQRTTSWKQNRLLKPAMLLYRAAGKVLGSLKMGDNLYLVLRKKEGA